MNDRDKIILKKILKYIEELQIFVKGYTYKDFREDKKTINACVFNLSQIGELAGKMSEDTIKNIHGIEWRGLKSLRNRIVHDYEGVNLSMIWGFLDTELELLKIQIIFIINENEN